MNPNGYPFMTRRQILERIDADGSFLLECVAIIQGRYESRDVSTGESRGWMASQATKGVRLAAKLASGEATEEDRVEAAQLVKGYSRQLARVFRERELAARPDLAAKAAVFGIGTPATATSPACASPDATPAGTSDQAATPTEQVPVQKRRGRPKGSKNKPKTDHTARRRRSRT